jgi:hypothetical protein
MLIAAIRSGSPLAGKAVSFSEDDGKFWLTGVGEISADRLVEYEQAGELEWADDATRSWALQRAGGETAASVPPPAPPRPAVSDAPPASVSTPSTPPPETEVPTSRVAPVSLEAGDEQPASVIPAPLARRGKRAERPDFVAGEKERWRPSETQWRAAGYVVIALAMIAAVVVMGIWRLGSDEPAGADSTGAAARLEGASSGSSEPFELTSGTHRLSFTVERTSLGVVSNYTFCVVPTGTSADKETDFAVVRGIIDPNLAAGAKSGDVPFDRTAGSYYLKVFSDNCSWTVEVSATN